MAKSLAVQQRRLEGWAMQRGQQLDGVIVEPGVSGAVPFNEHPEGAKLWADLRKGDTLVAAKLDRMFRSASDCLAVVEAFKARGVSLFLLDLNGGADDVSGNGIARLFLTIVSAFAEFERDRIGERIRATKRAQRRAASLSAALPLRLDARRRAQAGAGARAAEGATADPHAAGQGLSPYQIADDLKARGTPLSHVTIRKVIAGRQYDRVGVSRDVRPRDHPHPRPHRRVAGGSRQAGWPRRCRATDR